MCIAVCDYILACIVLCYIYAMMYDRALLCVLCVLLSTGVVCVGRYGLYLSIYLYIYNVFVCVCACVCLCVCVWVIALNIIHN